MGSGGGTLAAAMRALPGRYPGPGGAAAVVRDGAVLEAGAWGFADAEARALFTSATLFPACSITKQFTVATVLRHAPDPERLAPLLHDRLPRLERRPTVASLCHNQSGLRDSWALATISGAPAEGRFDDDDTASLFGRIRSLQFATGTRYSYCNGNFRLLSDLLERDTGRPFATLLRNGVLDQAEMPTARLVPDTSCLPPPMVGHEGSERDGWRPVVNRIVWRGDAGLLASLDDMIAWERFIDRTRDDGASPYGLLSRPVGFADGRPALYGWGLARFRIGGHEATGHGGALRGFRATRLRIAAARLSVVVLFNHKTEARAAAIELAQAALGVAADGVVAGGAPRGAPGPVTEGTNAVVAPGRAHAVAPEGAHTVAAPEGAHAVTAPGGAPAVVAFGGASDPAPGSSTGVAGPDGAPAGWFVDDECGLAARLAPDGTGDAVRLGWATVADTLRPTGAPDTSANDTWANDTVRLQRAADGWRMSRALDGIDTVLRPVRDDASLPEDLVGRWWSDELDTELAVVDAGGVLFAAVRGPAGAGRMEALRPFGRDRALLPCPRALDEGAPGDWTLSLGRDGSGRATTLTVGCWLARGLAFRRV